MSHIKILKLIVGSLQTNTYLLVDNKNQTSIIIDPGDDSDYIIQVLEKNSLKPEMIIATHGHFDHILAVLDLQLTFNIPFLIHEKDVFLVKESENSANYFLGLKPKPIPQIDKFLSDNIIFADEKINIVSTPGHTPGSVSLVIKSLKAIISGDLLFQGGNYGRTDFRYSNHSELLKSIIEILSYPNNYHIYPGHGEETTIKSEKAYYINR